MPVATDPKPDVAQDLGGKPKSLDFVPGPLGPTGLDAIDANLTGGGPPSIGGQSASLTPFIRDVASQFCYQEVGHLR